MLLGINSMHQRAVPSPSFLEIFAISSRIVLFESIAPVPPFLEFLHVCYRFFSSRKAATRMAVHVAYQTVGDTSAPSLQPFSISKRWCRYVLVFEKRELSDVVPPLVDDLMQSHEGRGSFLWTKLVSSVSYRPRFFEDSVCGL